MKLIYDMYGLVWTALLAGKDEENGWEIPDPDKEGKTLYINGHEFGYENAMNSVQAVLKKFNCVPSDIIMVFEGANAKALRLGISPEYKANRSHSAESYVEFNKAMEMVKTVLRELGATGVKQDGMEADDVVAYLAKTIPGKKTVVSNDGDFLKMYSDTCDVYIGGVLNENKYGIFPFHYVTLYKSLVGDSSDNIQGAFGFGAKAFEELYIQFDDDGLELLEDLVINKKLENLAEDVPSFKKLQKIIDDKESVYRSYDLAKFYDHKVNTHRMPLQWEPGMVHPQPTMVDDRFTRWYAQIKGVTADNFDDSLKHAVNHFQYSPFVALDIETSTGEESDAWMEAKQKKGGGEAEERSGVDVFGSELSGFSITYGDNMQYSVYFSVDHKDTNNISKEQARKVLRSIPPNLKIIVHNFAFEGPVIMSSLGSLS